MFTGLIEEVGRIRDIEPISGGVKLTISAQKILDDLKIDDSVSINGVCLTAVAVGNDHFIVEAVGETLDKTTIDGLKPGTPVNLERALRLADRLGGHLVQGHVNGIGVILRWQRRGDNRWLEVEIPEHLQKYLIEEGSIAMDGVSLTIAALNGNKVGVSVIPHTCKNTVMSGYAIGQRVNIETDFLAKYVEKMLGHSTARQGLTEDKLKRMGY